MQGQSVKTKGEIARMYQRQDQYQILQDNLHQRMDYHHSNWTNFDSRVTSMETQNQIALSVAHGVEDRHAILEEKHETLEEKHAILQEKYDDMSHTVAKFLSF
ncbi:unnamed protein product [Lactuca virosa]|uniref:Uncharacterized protein n=1 Tax=Lactuca virosa TaxID=75947 RepID=A0AAU9MIK6_9ASTR|nr:unnamed protein product [Lactuca virosa]